jgi:hypothetical protein
MRGAWLALVIVGCGGKPAAAPDGAQPTQLTLDEIGRACESASACIANSVTLLSCMSNLDKLDSPVSIHRSHQVRCLAAAGADCDAAAACIGVATATCQANDYRCEGDTYVFCRVFSGIATNCRGGLWYSDDSTCVERSGSHPDCGQGTCAPDTPQSCRGTRMVRCFAGVRSEIDCAQIGMTCLLDGGVATCGGSGAACTASRCDGDRLIRCQGGHEAIYDCAAMLRGGSCVAGGPDGFSCGFGRDCGNTATCAGATAQLCVLGGQASVNCLAEGFTSCVNGGCL